MALCVVPRDANIYFPGMTDKHTVPIMCAFVFTEGYQLNRSFSKVGTLSLANDLSSGVYFFYVFHSVNYFLSDFKEAGSWKSHL